MIDKEIHYEFKEFYLPMQQWVQLKENLVQAQY
jgi:hypothetical protein